MGFLNWALSLISAATVFVSCSFALSLDGYALLELKSGFNDTRNSLENWRDSDESPCSWTGVSCNPQDQRVVSINLPYMQLGGIISPSIGKLSRLQRLALHQNSLHGTIPDEITNCTELRAMYLRGNFLQGEIPPSIGNLTFLTILDLSSNTLKGAIPSSMSRLTRLRSLNMSANFLSGEIPDIGVLSRFGPESFTGNLDLCGPQIHKPYPPKRSSRLIKGILIGAMSTMAVAFIIIFVFLWVWMLSKKERTVKKYTEVKKQKEPSETSKKLITFHGDLPYSSTELIEKLESLDEEDIVGSGGFGTVYRMVMNDLGTFAVKKIDRSRQGSDRVFEREVEILGSVKHINLVNLRGYCRLPTSRLLIYDYLTLGSLDHLLHERDQEDGLLNWNARLRVALGSARGLAYLHRDCSPKIVHRDIKSSNILLSDKLEPRVSDFGLAKLLVDEEAHVTTVVAGTFGYLAPVKKYTEVKKQKEPSETSKKLITFHGDLPYSSTELIEKLESLDEEDIVGSGGFGTVYRMVMNDLGTFAVKKIDRSRQGSDRVFEREVEILGSVKHINLVNLRGYCRLPTSRLLIYDYLTLGSLDHLLHERDQEDGLLNWNARLRVALGSARGLAYLHRDCSPKIVHRDIKSSNILLSDKLEPRVSDFGLAKLLVDEEAHVTTVVAGTFGYLAPEYLQNGRATEKSDVYSFGVLLLELVTGKRPTDTTFVKRGLNVVGWMNTLLKEDRLEDVMDKRCADVDEDSAEVLIEIAARCTAANPEDRPAMNQVVQLLEQEVMSPSSAIDYYDDSHSDYC
ncbi:hypothetical protein F2Q69_00005112 [Brassica cretica]|uniref:non-specific serine/threonine protein kinase n=1 Tax=Brassica cretica TaxID=69181 RepID=A0A8S9NS84_BRACR|nr:hypothetical protein F2Q69_00005112 [Brassica cretica]